MWYCSNCKDGEVIGNNGTIQTLTPTSVDSNDQCVHCGHFAYFGNKKFDNQVNKHLRQGSGIYSESDRDREVGNQFFEGQTIYMQYGESKRKEISRVLNKNSL